MSKTKEPEKAKSAVEIQEAYWEQLLESGKQPASVYSFCKSIEIEEKDFYPVAPSFAALEAQFWKELVQSTQEVLDADEDYQSYDARGKLLAFFYTYFEHALAYRSRFLLRFPRREKALFCPSLKGMKSAFDDCARSLMEAVVAEGSSAIPAKLTEESYRGGWPVFLFLIDFWLSDTSDGFQDTDSLIEKTVKFGHEVTHFTAIEAALDLGKFLFGRSK